MVGMKNGHHHGRPKARGPALQALGHERSLAFNSKDWAGRNLCASEPTAIALTWGIYPHLQALTSRPVGYGLGA